MGINELKYPLYRCKFSSVITQRQIETYAENVARQFRPLKIVLFGSYAYGNPTEDSDVDLMVVMPKDPSGVRNRDKAIAIDSNYATAYNNRCYVLAQLKRYQNALVDCDKALAQEPNNAEFLDTRALVYKGLGRIKNAIADLERILQLSKDAALIERTNAMLVTLKK